MKLFSLLLYLVTIIVIANAQLTCFICDDCQEPFDNNAGLLQVCDTNNADAIRPGLSGPNPITVTGPIVTATVSIPTLSPDNQPTAIVPTIGNNASVSQSPPILVNQPTPTFQPPIVSIEPVPTSSPPLINNTVVFGEGPPEGELEAHETPITHKYDRINRDQILKIYNFPEVHNVEGTAVEYYCFRIIGINNAGDRQIRRGCIQHFGTQQQTCALSLQNITTHPDGNHCHICNTSECNDSATNIKISILTLITMIFIALRIQN